MVHVERAPRGNPSATTDEGESLQQSTEQGRVAPERLKPESDKRAASAFWQEMIKRRETALVEDEDRAAEEAETVLEGAMQSAREEAASISLPNREPVSAQDTDAGLLEANTVVDQERQRMMEEAETVRDIDTYIRPDVDQDAPTVSYDDEPQRSLSEEEINALTDEEISIDEGSTVAESKALFFEKAQKLKEVAGEDASLDAVKALLLAGAGAGVASETLKAMERKAPAEAKAAKAAAIDLKKKVLKKSIKSRQGFQENNLGLFGKAGLIIGGATFAGVTAFVGRLFQGWREGLSQWLPKSWGDRLRKSQKQEKKK